MWEDLGWSWLDCPYATAGGIHLDHKWNVRVSVSQDRYCGKIVVHFNSPPADDISQEGNPVIVKFTFFSFYVELVLE